MIACSPYAAVAGPAVERLLGGTPEGGARWRIAVPVGRRRVASGTARTADGFLLFALALGGRRESPWSLLGANAGFAGGARLALRGRAPLLHACAELPLDADCPFEERLAEIRAGLADAAALALGGGGRMTRAAAPDAGPDDESLGDALRETGWPCELGAAPRVRLEVPHAVLAACGERDVGGGTRWHVALCAVESPSRACRRALGEMLLRASGAFRLVRATAGESDGRVQVGLEAVTGRGAAPRELHHALAALSIAARHCAREVAALAGDEALARAYLALLGPMPRVRRRENHRAPGPVKETGPSAL